MAQKTNLNVSPYYDDFDTSKNFHKVLYRPGFAVQARELTSQQSILQNQVEEMGRNIFKEGAIISGGEVGMDKQYYAVKIQGTFNTTDITSNISSYKDKIITGATSGAQGVVTEYRANPIQTIQQLLEYADVDNTLFDFLDQMRDSFMTAIPETLASGVSKRNLIKNIKDLYINWLKILRSAIFFFSFVFYFISIY